MKPLARLFGAALVGAFALLASPAAQAQVGVTINIGAPAWGPQVPYGTQYYYIPEIDGYYDLYAQQYIVYQDGYWVPLPQLYGYDPYQFHPVIVDYRGPQPWQQIGYYRQRYAYQPYRNYGPGRGGYYSSYGYNGYGGGYNRPGAAYPNGRSYNNHDGYRGNDNRAGGQYPGGGYNPPRGNQPPQQPQGSYNPSQGGPRQPGGGNNGGGRTNSNGGGGRGNSHGRS